MCKLYYEELKNMDNNNDKLFGFMEKMYGEMQEGFKELDSKIGNNTIILEEVRTNIKTIAEVQDNHIKQNESQHMEMMELTNEKVDIIELAVKNLARDIHRSNNKMEILVLEEFNIKADIKDLKIVQGGKVANE